MSKKNLVSKNLSLTQYDHPDQFGKLLGYKVIKIDRKKFSSEVVLTLKEHHLSPAKRVHGGVISALFDYACGAAVFSTLNSSEFCSTVELKVNYLKPLVRGDVVSVKARVIFRGKKLCVIHSLLYRNGEKKPSAMATATFNIVSPARDKNGL